MTRLKLTLLILLAALVAGCEKAIIGEDAGGGKEEHENTDSGGKDVIDPDTANIDFLTVAGAQAEELGEVICVRGYVVASCSRSMSNADFKAPFAGSTAIILADEPVDLDDFQYVTDEHLFPVCLTDYKDVRAALNLEDNPRLWNRMIFITGVKARYMSCPGMKKVLGYQIVE